MQLAYLLAFLSLNLITASSVAGGNAVEIDEKGVNKKKLMRREKKKHHEAGTSEVEIAKEDMVEDMSEDRSRTPPQLYFKICHGHSGTIGSGRCLEDSLGSLTQYTGTAETWQFIRYYGQSDGIKWHQIKSHNGLILSSSGPSMVTSGTSDNELYQIIQDGSYVRLKSRSGQYLEGHSSLPSDYPWEHNDGMWTVTPTTSSNGFLIQDKGTIAVENQMTDEERKDLANGIETLNTVYYKVCHHTSSSLTSGKCLEDSAGTLGFHSGTAETWTFVNTGESGGVKWHNVKSHGGKCLKGGNTPELSSSCSGDSKKWEIVWDGSYIRFRNKAASRPYVEGHTGSVTEYTYEHNDGKWTMVPQSSGNGL